MQIQSLIPRQLGIRVEYVELLRRLRQTQERPHILFLLCVTTQFPCLECNFQALSALIAYDLALGSSSQLIITAFVLSASNLSGYPNIEFVISLFRAILRAIFARYCLNHLSQPRFDRQQPFHYLRSDLVPTRQLPVIANSRSPPLPVFANRRTDHYLSTVK